MITPTSWTGRTGFLASPPHSRGFLMEMSSGCSGGTFSKTFWFSLLPILNWTSPPNLSFNYTTGFPREIKPCRGWSHSPGQTLLLRSQFPFSSSSHNNRLIKFNLLHHGHGYDLYIQGDPTPPGSDVSWEEVSLVGEPTFNIFNPSWKRRLGSTLTLTLTLTFNIFNPSWKGRLGSTLRWRKAPGRWGGVKIGNAGQRSGERLWETSNVRNIWKIFGRLLETLGGRLSAW